ncbi:MAG: enoyl-CoA hydratase/isomerase family protein [Candidatus Marinimicrobia bacterium]|nr:enoyl-CoA hydratase/isomerase family protein [Candidatus Neomarinimicrobiota bacterium]
MKYVQVSTVDQSTVITISRPEALNALNETVIEELGQAFDMAAVAASRAVILTGAGDRAFIAGADIKDFQGMSVDQARKFALEGQALTLKIEGFPKPVIAAVNGFALGGGCELAMACHFRIASTAARFGQPEVSLGIIAGFGGTQRLPRLVGKGIALELLTTGRTIDADEALSIGLVNEVAPPEELLAACHAKAARIAKQGPLAVQLTIEAVNRGENESLDQGLHIESDLFARSFTTEDMREGVSAFIEKRKAVFKGS